MGARGPKKTPTAVLNARGSWRGKERAGEPAVEAGAPPAPAWLEDDARECWDQIVAELVPLGVMTVLDQTALAILCQALMDYLEARRQLKDEGMIAVGESGNPYQHPAVGIQTAAWKRVLQACREFGLTPSARANLKVEPPKKQDDDKARFFKLG